MWQLFINSRVWTVPAFISRFTGLCIFWPFGDKHTDKEGPQEKEKIFKKYYEMPRLAQNHDVSEILNKCLIDEALFCKNHRRELLDEMLPRLLWTNWMLMLFFWKSKCRLARLKRSWDMLLFWMSKAPYRFRIESVFCITAPCWWTRRRRVLNWTIVDWDALFNNPDFDHVQAPLLCSLS